MGDDLGRFGFRQRYTSAPLSPANVCLQILVAFVLFDTDGDGKLAFEEVKTYITSVLRVVRALGQDATGEFWEDNKDDGWQGKDGRKSLCRMIWHVEHV